MKVQLVRQFAFAATAALTLAACSESQNGPVDPQFAKGVSAPKTDVTATAIVKTEDTEVIEYFRNGPDKHGNPLPNWCDADGRWTNSQGSSSQNVDHGNCRQTVIIPGTEITLTFTVLANYVLSSNGNVQLNFHAVKDAFGTCIANCAATVQYTKNQNRRVGSGVISALGSDNSEWEFSLSDASGTGIGGLASDVRSLSGLGAVEINGAGRISTATITWQ